MSSKKHWLCEADMPMAYMPRKKRISLLQMDGNFTPEEFKRALGLAIRACEQIYEAQRNALKEKYAPRQEEGIN